MLNDENPQVPKEGNVEALTPSRVDAIRARLASEKGETSRVFTTSDAAAPEQALPEGTTFAVTLKGPDGQAGEVVLFDGYLVATSVFVGFADEEGIIKGLVPIDNVLCVEQAVDVVAEDE